jgi:hypothetical protein
MGELLRSLWNAILAKANPGQLCVACVVLTGIGGYVVLTQYVRADEMRAEIGPLRLEQREIRLEILEGKIIEARIQQCRAMEFQRGFYADRVGELQRKYTERSGFHFILPACSEL